jgi:hypothetical protein
MIQVGERYAVFEEDQHIVADKNCIIRNFGIVEKECLKEITDICEKCGNPLNGKFVRAIPYHNSFYGCLCNYSSY